MTLKTVFLIMAFSIFTACIPEIDDSPDLEHSSHCEIINSCSDMVYFQQTIKNWYYENNKKNITRKSGLNIKYYKITNIFSTIVSIIFPNKSIFQHMIKTIRFGYILMIR